LRRRFPALRIEFSVADWQGNMIEEGLDLALRVGQFPSDDLATRYLGEIHRYLVASPAYLAQAGAPARPEDLRDHDCIIYGYGPIRTTWEIGGTSHRVSGGFKANSSEAVHRAVMSGLGIGLLPVIQVEKDIAGGRLQRVLADHPIESLKLSVVHVEATRMLPRIAAALDFLTDQFPG
jgi:DNA-binding transcriptional LysR family regulator